MLVGRLLHITLGALHVELMLSAAHSSCCREQLHAMQLELGPLADYNGPHHAQHALLTEPENYEKIESGLTWLGVAGLQDPPRPEVRGAIERCADAGIRVRPLSLSFACTHAACLHAGSAARRPLLHACVWQYQMRCLQIDRCTALRVLEHLHAASNATWLLCCCDAVLEYSISSAPACMICFAGQHPGPHDSL